MSKFTVEDAYNIIHNEDIGYAVSSYCRGSDFEDEKLVKLWDEANEALKNLKNYIEKKRNVYIS